MSVPRLLSVRPSSLFSLLSSFLLSSLLYVSYGIVPCIQSLPLDESCKKSALFDQFVVGAILDDFSPVQYKDTVAVSDRAQPVGYYDTGAAHGIQRFGYLPLGLIIVQGELIGRNPG
jgi:hypothetical protein